MMSLAAQLTPGTKTYCKAKAAIREAELRESITLVNEQRAELNSWRHHCEAIEKIYKEELTSRETRHQTSIQRREDLIKSLADQLARLKQENSALLSSISKANSAQGPVNQETYYVDEFDSLNHLIQSSVAKMFKWSCETELPSYAIDKVHKFLECIEPHGNNTLKMLTAYNLEISILHKNAAQRIALVRHLIAVLLWDKVLRHFAFGLDGEIDKNLRAVEQQLISGSSLLNYPNSRGRIWKGFDGPAGIGSSRIATS